MKKDNLINIIDVIQKHTLNCEVCREISADAIIKLYNEELKSLLKLLSIAKNFVIDARGSWETGEGNYLIEEINKLEEKENVK